MLTKKFPSRNESPANTHLKLDLSKSSRKDSSGETKCSTPVNDIDINDILTKIHGNN